MVEMTKMTKKMISKESGMMIAFVSLFLVVISVLVGLSMVTSGVIGANQSTTVAKVYVWNTEPDLYRVDITPSSIDLSPGNTTEVNCTAYIWDYNSWQDFSNISASLYDVSVGDGNTADNNFRYINTSCGNSTTACIELSDTNASCTCTFDVWYYANNGTWQCNMTIWDNAGNATERPYYLNATMNSSFGTINTVVGIGTIDELDYGNLSVTETSTEKPLNISNYGNVPINITVRGYGGTDSTAQNNQSLHCAYGNITLGYQRFAAAPDTAFDDMFNLTNITADVPAFELPVRTNDTNYGNDTNATYWRLQVPLTVGGNCNGTIEFTAYETATE